MTPQGKYKIGIDRRFYLKIIFLIIAGFAVLRCFAEDAVFCFYDTEGYSISSPSPKKDGIIWQIAKTGADIVVLAEIKDEQSLKEIQKLLGEKYVFAGIAEAVDKERRLAVISAVEPEKFEQLTDVTYKIKETKMPVLRGFIHAVFNFKGYKTHLLAAHLKSREKDPVFNQTDMRRYEARQLRYAANDILGKEPEANILVLGNMNDTCGMSPIKEIYSRRFGMEKMLFDLRPADSFGTTWTFWNPETDDYERIDYALATAALIPEIVREKTFLTYNDGWERASKHRLFLITLACGEKEFWTKEKLEKFYPNCIYSDEKSHVEGEKEIGEKRKRNPPVRR